MILRRQHLGAHPTVFRAMTGLCVPLLDDLLEELPPAYHQARTSRLDRPDRQRAQGGGDHFDLEPEDQILLTIVWLRQYPTQEVLCFLFGVSDSTALRAIARCLPLLEQSGKDTMRMPDPGRGRREKLPQLLAETPELAVIIDTFEQRIQRPGRQQRAYYSGKKKAHTLKSQVTADEETGKVADIAESRPGRWADLKVLKKSKLKRRVPEGVGASGRRGTVPTWGSPTGTRRGSGPPPVASRGVGLVRRKTGVSTGRSPGVESWWSIRTVGCVATRP
jgi:hypothetical protein